MIETRDDAFMKIGLAFEGIEMIAQCVPGLRTAQTNWLILSMNGERRGRFRSSAIFFLICSGCHCPSPLAALF